ncbi:MAG TPA: hypothetical protein VJT67_02400 [Longimicrobiaceae bacterium]|nr:hypothetical protein [Longimicrobiaceae bacterium]
MNKRYVRRKYRHQPGQTPRPRRLTANVLPPIPDDPREFDQLVHQRIEKLFGGPLEAITHDPELRAVVYDAVAKGLRAPSKPIPRESLEFAARMQKHGVIITPGTSDFSDLPEPLDLGWSLSDAIIEYRRHNP